MGSRGFDRQADAGDGRCTNSKRELRVKTNNNGNKLRDHNHDCEKARRSSCLISQQQQQQQSLSSIKTAATIKTISKLDYLNCAQSNSQPQQLQTQQYKTAGKKPFADSLADELRQKLSIRRSKSSQQLSNSTKHQHQQPPDGWRSKSTVILNLTNAPRPQTLPVAVNNTEQEQVDDHEQQKQQSARAVGSTPPTFGSIPQRISSLTGIHTKYFGGLLRNASSSSSSSSSSLLPSSSLARPSLTQLVSGARTSPSKSLLPTEISRNNLVKRRSYNNISNLFPAPTTRSSTPTTGKRQSTDSLDSAAATVAAAKTSHLKSQMRRQNSSAAGAASLAPQRRWPSYSYGSQTPRRPASATAVPAYRARKSPSMTSLHAQQDAYDYHAGAAYDYPPITTHHQAHAQPLPPGALYGRLAKSSLNLNPQGPVGGAPSNDELFYDDYQPQQQQQQHHRYYPADARGSGSLGHSGALYSPQSPPLSPYLVPGGAGTGTAPFYAPGSSSRPLYVGSRFALHQPSTGRSTLAPPHEQLRRMLGYQPAVAGAAGYAHKSIHLHPQWAFSRPFAHLRSPADDDADLDQLDDNDDDDDDGASSQGRPVRLRRPNFVPFNRLDDQNVLRACDWHPSGEVYAIGSNSKTLRICAYPADHELRHFSAQSSQHRLGAASGGGVGAAGEQATSGSATTAATAADATGATQTSRYKSTIKTPRVLFKFLQVHRGSIYCTAFNATGQMLATGSNDQTVRFWRYNALNHSPDGDGYRLTMHSGTVRDVCFIDDLSNNSALLLSAGGGDNKVYVTDCDTATPFQSLAGHTAMVMSLAQWGGASFVSGSYDKTLRFWDLRSRTCTAIVSAPPSDLGNGGGGGGLGANASSKSAVGPGAAVCAVRVDPTGRLLVSGHADSSCMLYDIRAGRIIQTFKAHDDEVRTLSFSPRAYYLLSGGYDGKLMLSDLQGDLTQELPTVCIADGQDKVIQAKWHPHDFTFVACCANKAATLWAIPQE